jgi:hypothetical protein
MNGYTESLTRLGAEGVLDKMVLIEALADKYADQRDFHEEVMRRIRGSGSAADTQILAWERVVESLPYRRENGEVLRNPELTLGVNGEKGLGGDCDDLVTLFLAGCKVLGVPCRAEVIAGPQGNGFHIRARVGLPPSRPKTWVVVDPVIRSEKEWAMANRNPLASPLIKSQSQLTASQTPPMVVNPPSQSTPNWLLLAGVGSVAYLLGKKAK